MKSTASGADDTHRRKWDKEEYAERARQRELKGDDDDFPGKKRKLEPPPGPRANLKQRDFHVDLTSQLGKTQVVTPVAALNMQAGYFCSVCDCVVKDSANYLDHINGKKHQKALGMSMRVERSSLHQVQERFEKLKQQQDQKPLTEEDFDLRILRRQEEEEDRKKGRKERKKDKKKSGGNQEADDGGMDPEMAAMMGFGGFGTTKKS